jgi:predicted dehydrogenase
MIIAEIGGGARARMLVSALGLSLAAVWARRAPAAVALAHEHGTAAVGSFDDLLAACDAVAFTVPADVQAQLAVTAARAGKHLLLEKPDGSPFATPWRRAAGAVLFDLGPHTWTSPIRRPPTA